MKFDEVLSVKDDLSEISVSNEEKIFPTYMEDIKNEAIRRYPHLKDYQYVVFEPRYDRIREIYKKYHDLIKPSIYDMDVCFKDTDVVERFVDGITYIEKWDAYIVEITLSTQRSFSLIFINDKNNLPKLLPSEKRQMVPNGVSEVLRGPNSTFFFSPCEIKYADEPILQDDFIHYLKNDINKFFTKREFYKKNEFSYRRGILIYGPPGNGKTLFIRNLLKEVGDEKVCLLVNCEKLDLTVFDFLKKLPHKKDMIIVMEDIDSFKYARSTILNFLDGVDSIERCVVIATTNYPEKVDSALINRPGRFDKIYHFSLPEAKRRAIFLKKFFPDMEKTVLDECVKKTKGFSCAYFKEIFLTANLNDITPLEAVERLRNQLELCKKFSSGVEDDTFDYVC